MDITTHSDGAFDRLNIGLFGQNLFGFGAQFKHLFLRQVLALHQALEPTVHLLPQPAK